MSVKITTTSPVSFDAWFTQKIEEFMNTSQEEKADTWLAAMRAKTAAEEAANATITVVDDRTVILSDNIQVPEFDTVFNQWVAEHNVQFAFEEV
jgi:hypothetical protein